MTRIYIGNLPPETKEEDLRSLIDPVVAALVPNAWDLAITIDHQTWSAPPPHEVTLSRGFAFLNVDTDDQSVAQEICDALRGQTFRRRKIEVRPQGGPKKAERKPVDSQRLIAGMKKLGELKTILPS
jgi:RNA recognition motif-containing protein